MRRRNLILALIVISGFNPATAQFFSSYGVKAGLALSNQSYVLTPIDYQMDTKSILSPNLAFVAELFKADHFSMQTDLAFACRGSSTTTRSVTVHHLEGDRLTIEEGEKATSRFRYLSLSPMLRARTGNEGIDPYALLGPRLDLFLYYSSQSEYPLEEQNHFILGLSMGVGIEFPLQRNALFAEIQFQPDLSPVTNREPLLVNNNSLVFTVGIRWDRSP